MSKVKEVFALVVEADVQGATTALRQFAATAKKELGDAEKSSSAFHQSMAVGGAKVAAGGAVTLAALASLGLGARKVAGEVLGLQRVAGGSAEQMSVLRFAAQQTGLEVGTLQTAFVRLSKSASSDAGEKKLAGYGISARDAAGNVKPLSDLLGEVATAVSSMPNGAAKNDFVTSIFGRGGAALIPLLNKGAAGIADMADEAERYGAVLDGSTLEQAKRFTASQRDMKAAVDGIKTSIGSDVLPTLTALNEGGAELITTLAEGLQQLPDGLRQAAVGTAVVGSGVATVGGTLVSMVGQAGLAVTGASAIADKMSAVGATATSAAAGLGLATVALAGFTFAYTENQRQGEDGIKAAVDAAENAAGATRTKMQAAFLANTIEIGPVSATDFILDQVGQYEDYDNRVAAAAEQTARLKTELAGMSQTDAKAYLSELRTELINNAMSGKEADEALAGLWQQIGGSSSVTSAATADMAAYASAVEGAIPKVVTLGTALQGMADGVNPGEFSVYASSLKAATDPVFGLISANKKLETAQQKVASAASGESDAIRSAYKRVADAKQALDDVLADKAGNGLDQVSPEVQIAQARAKILEANTALLRNPTDANALTNRDQGLQAEDRAVQRRQDMKRDESQMARRERDARQSLADAEQGVQDAQKKQSADIESAKNDLVQAYLDRVSAEATLYDAIQAGAVDINAVGAQLQQAVDQGILPPDIVAGFVGKMTALTDQASAAADAVGVMARAAAQVPYTMENTLGHLPGFAGMFSGNDYVDQPQTVGQRSSTTTAGGSVVPTTRGSYDAMMPTSRGAGGSAAAGLMYRINDPGIEGFQPEGKDYVIPLTSGQIHSAGRMSSMTGAQPIDHTVINITESRGPRATAAAALDRKKSERFLRGRR